MYSRLLQSARWWQWHPRRLHLPLARMKFLSRVYSSRASRSTPDERRSTRHISAVDDANSVKCRNNTDGSFESLLGNEDPETFFNYTSGRWLWNERHQFARRHLKFNIVELARIAAHAMGSRSCTKLEKLSEGSFNKVFLMTMNDGRELIAKLPNPNAGPKHFITASEVATMDYVQNILRIPVPQVYGWNSSAENPVGAEYILMERCRGIELRRVWDDIADSQKASIIQKLVGFEAAFASSKFPMYGSLYYAKDLSGTKSSQNVDLGPNCSIETPSFAVGPSTDRSFFDHGRDSVEDDRGPWPTIEEYTLAGAWRELSCVEKCSEFPNQQGFFYGPRQYQPSSDVKRGILNNFIKVAKYLKPEDPILSKGVLWHTDLHSDNIFVNRDNPTEITEIIDWQAVHISPLFAQARHPTFLQFDGEIPEGFNASAIKLPDNYGELTAEEQRRARRLRGAQMLWKLYEIELACQCNDIHRAIRFGEGLLGRLPAFAGNIFSDGELLVEDLLIRLHDEWSKIVVDPSAEPCPISFSEKDKVAHEEQFALWGNGIQLMTEFLEKVGGYRGWDGWVSHEEYEAGKRRMEHLRQEFLERHASTESERQKWIEVWPFVDK